MRADYPNVVRWFLTCVNQPKFAKICGSVTLCEKTLVYDASKLKQAATEKKPKEAKPAEKNLEDLAEEEKKEKKEKNPLDLLPPRFVYLLLL